MIMDDDILLVSLVEQYPCLYDKNNTHFKDKVKKLIAWSTIAKKLSAASADECQKRFGMLRNKYAMEKRIMGTAAQSETDTVQPSKWYLFSYLSFLDVHVQGRRRRKAGLMDHSSLEDKKGILEKLLKTDVTLEELEEPEPKAITLPPGLRRIAPRIEPAVNSVVNSSTRTNSSSSNCSPSSVNKSFANTVELHLNNIRNSKRRRRVQSQIMLLLADANSDSENSS